MNLNHKHKNQVNFSNLKNKPVPEIPVINRPIQLNYGKAHQSFSNASGINENKT